MNLYLFKIKCRASITFLVKEDNLNLLNYHMIYLIMYTEKSGDHKNIKDFYKIGTITNKNKSIKQYTTHSQSA